MCLGGAEQAFVVFSWAYDAWGSCLPLFRQGPERRRDFDVFSHTSIQHWMFFGRSSHTNPQRFPLLVKRSKFSGLSSLTNAQRSPVLVQRWMIFGGSSNTHGQRWMS